MADEDRAQDIELREWERNNERKVGQVKFSPEDPGYGPEFCSNQSCEAEMPAARRAWGFQICIECQTRIEQRQQRMR